MSSKTFKATCHQIVRKAIRNSGFLDNVSDNRLSAIITNNLDLVLGETVTFKKKSQLAIAVEHFETAYGKDPDEKMLRELINEKHSVIASDIIEKVVGAFQTKLQSANKELKDFHADVVNLMARNEINITKFNRVDKESTLSSTALKYELWSGCSVMGPEDALVNEINSPITEDETPSLMAFSNFINKTKLRFNHESASNKPVVVSEEKKQAITEAISSSSGLGLRAAVELVDIIFSTQGVNAFITKMSNLINAIHSEAIDYTNNQCNMLQKFFKGYNKVIVPQSSEDTFLDSETVRSNVNFLREVQKGFAYYLCYLRYNHFSKVLILPNGAINNDVKDTALASNITKDDLRMAIFFKEHSYPGALVTIDYMHNNKDRMVHMLNGSIEHTNTMKKLEYKNTMRAAFDTSVREHFKSDIDAVNFNTLAKSVADEVADGAMSPEFGFYKLVMQEKKASPLTKTLFDEFGKSFASLQSQTSEVPDKRTVEEVQAAVLVKQIGSFLKSSFC